jgi:hypothetical protein
MSSGWVAIVMLAVFVVVAAAFAWQERAQLPQRSIIYGTDEAVAYVTSRLSVDAAAALHESDVRRILEWEIEYLQRQMLEGEEAVVVAGLDAARHAQERLHEQGHSYDGHLIVEVMELQAEYLLAIGAVADAADADEVADVFGDEESEGDS